MHPFIIYLIQVNLALVLFSLLYTILFKRDTFLHLRRLYFISAIVFSLLYTMFVVPGLSNVFNLMSNEPKAVETSVSFEAPSMELIVMEPEVAVASSTIPWKQISTVFYFSGTLFFICRFLWQLISIFRMRLKSEKTSVSGVKVYNLNDDNTPFSFFSMIFINPKMHSEEELKQIVIHEHTHVREKHSLDIILVETILLFSWWNPFVWLLKREIAMNLEYLADIGVLREGVDSRDYQYHLLRLTYHGAAVQIVNNFNVSQLKQRIMMMNKTRSSTLKLAKYLLMLPMFFILIAVNSSYADEKGQSLQEPPPVKKEVLEEIFVVVEEQPEYPGGTEAMMKFLSDSIVYPAEAKEKGMQGRVICNFVVMKDGRITDVNIVRGVDPLIDTEAVRVIESMPKWKPGRQRGKEVDVRFTIPVVFRLGAPMDSEDDTSERGSKVIIDGLMANPMDMSVTAVIMEAPFILNGNEEFVRYLIDHIRYPVIAQENGVQGLVNATVKYINNGQIISLKTQPESEKEAELSEEVVRVIKGAFQEMVKKQQTDRGESFMVSGKVANSNSSPLQGASVILKGTNMGTITDSNGNFQINVPSKEGDLTISFIGYKTEELALKRLNNSNSEITTELPFVFRLQGDNVEPYNGPTPENAVVVVGYGPKKTP